VNKIPRAIRSSYFISSRLTPPSPVVVHDGNVSVKAGEERAVRDGELRGRGVHGTLVELGVLVGHRHGLVDGRGLRQLARGAL